MLENLSGSTARLERLVRQIMKEEDYRKFDELGEEIWRVLDEREHAMCDSPSVAKGARF
jgi:methyl coenzyme M reductase subunit C-like uncharacterized protein (methanogenesis marker protein 7)